MKMRVIPFIIVIVLVGGFFVWDKYFTYDPIRDVEERYVEAMTADTYGGATPQETLAMFIQALLDDDLKLATKYFALDQDLSRERWRGFLETLKAEGKLGALIKDVSIAVPFASFDPAIQQFFIVYNQDQKAGLIFNMAFNQRTNIWKIASF